MVKIKDKALYNIIISSMGFCAIETATSVTLQAIKFISQEIKRENPNYTEDTYVGMALMFLTTSVVNWFLSSIISAIGPRTTIFLGFFVTIFYFLHFLLETSWLYYVACIVFGISGAFYWTGQANYLALNSKTADISRNAGIFWAFVQAGALFGTLILFGLHTDRLDKRKRTLFISIMAGITFAASFLVLLYGKAEYSRVKESFWDTFIEAMKLYTTKDMIVICPMLLYTGLESSLWHSTYSNTLANVEVFRWKKTTIISVSSMLISTGEILGGILFGVLGHKIRVWGHYPIVMVGSFLQSLSFISILLNIPNGAIKKSTSEPAMITSSLPLAFFCSFCLGIGDAAIITQCYSILPEVFVDKSDAAFCIFNCLQCLGYGIGFFLTEVELYGYISVLIVFSVLSLMCFIFLEKKSTYKPILSKIPVNREGKRIDQSVAELDVRTKKGPGVI